jgi:excisionase family DNA binding protein
MNDDTRYSTPINSRLDSIKNYPRVTFPQERRRGRAAISVQKPIKRLYSIEEAAHYLGISTWTVRNMTANGTLACVRFGKRKLIAIEDLEDLVMHNKESRDGTIS